MTIFIQLAKLSPENLLRVFESVRKHYADKADKLAKCEMELQESNAECVALQTELNKLRMGELNIEVNTSHLFCNSEAGTAVASTKVIKNSLTASIRMDNVKYLRRHRKSSLKKGAIDGLPLAKYVKKLFAHMP